jgi:hypothetical protein
MCQRTRSIHLHYLHKEDYLSLAHRNCTFNLTFARCLDFCSWFTSLDQAHRGCVFPLNFALDLHLDFYIRHTKFLPLLWLDSQDHIASRLS